MADHIPIITGEDVAGLTQRYYGDSGAIRVPLDRVDRLAQLIPQGPSLWLDPCFDGCHDIAARRGTPGAKNAWYEFMKGLPHFDKLLQSGYPAKPVQSEVNNLVRELLDRCLVWKPKYITVPQIPLTGGTDRNKLNRSLADATGKWKSTSGFSGRMILPLIFVNQRQVNRKTDRNPKVKQAENCYQEAQADGLWTVDQSLADDSGSATLISKRFPGVIALHEELNERICPKVRLGGPYWGLNLVLWARRLIDNPLIGVGSGYHLHLSGGQARKPSARIAIPSLRRRVKVTPQLRQWFDKAIKDLDSSHPARPEFEQLRSSLTLLSDAARARQQVAEFYKRWFDEIASGPETGRSMALFQDLSTAYALGKSLPPFRDEGTSRRPEAVVEPLMLSSL